MINPEEDGISHINIYSKGKTELGRMLSNFYKCPINTEDGKFMSVEGYWYWLGMEECQETEALRTSFGYQAKKLGSALKKDFPSRKDGRFEEKVMKAIWQKTRVKYRMFDTEINKLPFEHYYNYGGNVVDVKDKYPWMIDGIDSIRNYVIKKVGF